MTEQIKLTKSDRQRVWWRSQFLQGSWNYERMQNMGWAYALIPALKKLYTSPEDRAAALERHMEFFNTHPYVAAPIIGVTLALEEERANGTPIDDKAIQGVKIGMMGPLAGIGDPVFWFTIRPILGALGASLASTGNIVGPLLFFFGWNLIRMAFLWYTQEFGYKAGSEITKDMSGGILQDITKGASILGMFILAVLVQRWVSINFTIDLPGKQLSDGAYVVFPDGAVKGAELKTILANAIGGMSPSSNPSRTIGLSYPRFSWITPYIPLHVVIEEKSFSNRNHHRLVCIWYPCSPCRYYVINQWKSEMNSGFFFMLYVRKIPLKIWYNNYNYAMKGT